MTSVTLVTTLCVCVCVCVSLLQRDQYQKIPVKKCVYLLNYCSYLLLLLVRQYKLKKGCILFILYFFTTHKSVHKAEFSDSFHNLSSKHITMAWFFIIHGLRLINTHKYPKPTLELR